MARTEGRRSSRRLRGLPPEEELLEQVCFICQRGIDIDLLSRCTRTSCCKVFLHTSCHRQMMLQSPSCGNCRHPNPEFEREIVLETDEEMQEEDNPFELVGNEMMRINNNAARIHTFVRDLNAYADTDRPTECHQRGSLQWDIIPFHISSVYWLELYRQLKRFVREHTYDAMYIHGRIVIPRRVTREMRRAIYRLFLFNIPASIYEVVRYISFRLLFVYDAALLNIHFEDVTLSCFSGGPPFYANDHSFYV